MGTAGTSGAGNQGDTQFGNTSTSIAANADAGTASAETNLGTVTSQAAQGDITNNTYMESPEAIQALQTTATEALQTESQTASSAEDAAYQTAQGALQAATAATTPASTTFLKYTVIGVGVLAVAAVLYAVLKGAKHVPVPAS